MQVKKQQLELDMEQWTSSKLGKEYVKAVYCYPAYLTYMQSTAGVQPWWIQGDSKVGTESASLEKYIFNYRHREIRNE